VSGLGTAFITRNWITAVVRALYRAALRRVATAFFQNPDDLQLFLHDRLVVTEKARLLPGSGVNVDRFTPMSKQRDAGTPFRFLLLGRLLWDKGIAEFVEAARQLRARNVNAEFVLMGFAGSENRSAVSMNTIQNWVDEGLITYFPPALDVRPMLAMAHCVVLPSYREGAPRSLLEASSMGIPIITSDVPGCRQAIEDGVTGYLSKVRNAHDLAEKMERMILLPDHARISMGQRGREKMMKEYDERIVIDAYLRAVREFVLT
jgi:glycosyltransferase involved in cell wall biosynthesis